MCLPTNLQRLIDNALVAIQDQSEFDLNLHYHIAIYDFFDALPNLKGRIARTHLSIMVAKQVFHVWDTMPEEHGYTTMPRLMVSTAEQLLSYLKRGVTAEQLEKLALEIKVKLIYGTETKPISRPIQKLPSRLLNWQQKWIA